ncbi:MAG: alpha-N-arabinofuranosidase [Prevotella sp.]|nr:alpha-N-arabinofuranosidase [Prevotella sp.]
MMQGIAAYAQQASDSIFVYSPNEREGLHAALRDSSGWQHIGRLCSSDYGTWGAEKRMYHPSLCRANDGSWRLVFQVNDRSPLFAAAYSQDLVNWRPQDYPRVSSAPCQRPVISAIDHGFNIYFKDGSGHTRRVFARTDFRTFSEDIAMPFVDESLWRRDTASVDGQQMTGQKFAVTASEAARLRSHFEQQAEDWRMSNERMHDDPQNLASLPAVMEATLTVSPTEQKAISPMLIGIFFEDISYAADGGLYAELIQNRDFEYNGHDHRDWTATTAWHSPTEITIASDNPLSPQNPHYALLRNDSLWNEGWDGIAVEAGKQYDFSIFVQGRKQFSVQLIAPDGTVLAQAAIKANSREWQRHECVLTASQTESHARLLLLPKKDRNIAQIDMVSLFPQETFMNRKNGLRRDLAQVIADLHPKFVRFPGGCMSHGQGLDNIYHWNQTIGPLEERVPDFNIWHYHQTRGLGFFEYFQFCEDIGAEPLPVLAAGVPCQNSANNADGIGGQQGGIPMDQMPAYVDELCNLIDWANGDPATNEWAAKRAQAGHPEPFNLKYIGIGNEDIISTVFEERFEMIARAMHERHPEIRICGTVGPFHSPSADYLEGWDFVRRNRGMQYMTDEHYYESTGWFLHHRDYYDSYPRLNADGSPATKVYLGEWAASTRVKRPNLETALAEALYLTDVERNGDIVEMTSYAPMLCKDGHSNWNPDMIYFTNTSVRTTPAYEVQRLFSLGSGDQYVASQIAINDSVLSSLNYRIGASIVKNSATGKCYLKLVNALPATLSISVSGMQLPATVTCLQLTGSAIDDQRASATTITTSEPTTLPPYSIRMIEL